MKTGGGKKTTFETTRQANPETNSRLILATAGLDLFSHHPILVGGFNPSEKY